MYACSLLYVAGSACYSSISKLEKRVNLTNRIKDSRTLIEISVVFMTKTWTETNKKSFSSQYRVKWNRTAENGERKNNIVKDKSWNVAETTKFPVISKTTSPPSHTFFSVPFRISSFTQLTASNCIQHSATQQLAWNIILSSATFQCFVLMPPPNEQWRCNVNRWR